MSEHLSALDTLALIHHELGTPELAVIAPCEGPRALRNAVAVARKRRGATLIAMPTSGSQTAHARTWFAKGASDGVQSVPFDGGILLLLHVPGRRSALPSRKTPKPKPWTTPDAAPVPGATESDLDDRVVRSLLRACDGEAKRPVHANGTATERYLGGYGLLAHDGTAWRPTVAAMVLCGLRPEIFIPGCAVQLVVDGESTKIKGPLRRLLRDTLRWMPDDIDQHVVSEAVANALFHRDWASDEPARVHLDRQRLTVSGHGSLGQRGQQPPNPLLLQLARHLGLASGQGRGLRDIGERLAAKRLPPPSLFECDGTVVFVTDFRGTPRQVRSRETTRDLPRLAETPVPTVFPPPVVVPAPPAPPSLAAVVAPAEMVWESVATAGPVAAPPRLPAALRPAPVPSLLPRDPDDRAAVVLAHLRSHRDASTRELADALGCSRPVIGKLVSILVDEGRIRPLLASSRSPHQRYALVEDHPER